MKLGMQFMNVPERHCGRGLSNYDPALSDTALANEQAALETAISRLEAGLSFGDMRRAPRGAIARYILVLILGSAFLAGLVTLIRTERIDRFPAASQSVIWSANFGKPARSREDRLKFRLFREGGQWR